MYVKSCPFRVWGSSLAVRYAVTQYFINELSQIFMITDKMAKLLHKQSVFKSI